jgi:hypothetical protein
VATSKASSKASAPKTPALTQLEFENDGRTFKCERAPSAATPDTYWWWVSITGESQRYAAFRAEPNDTKASLQPRVLAYYAQLLVDRARPREIRTGWGRPPGKKTEVKDD